MKAKDYRSIARKNLAGKWWISIAIAAIAWVLGGCVVGSGFVPDLNLNLDAENLDLASQLGGLVAKFAGVVSVIGLIQVILGGAVELGYAKILLAQHDGGEYKIPDLFSEFHRFGTGLAQLLLRFLYIFLWTLLFCIPGIIAAYRYAMTPFILVENPEMSASEAIKRSKELMHGHKWELFCMRLSFFGWHLLAALTLNVGNLALNPYLNAAEAAFYRKLTAQPEVVDAQS